MADVEEKSVEETVDSVEVSPKKKTKKRKREPEPGVIYLSRIPTGMNVKKIRQVFEDYGEIGRMFIQPDEKLPSHKKNRVFIEGWVEFLDKKIAKSVALALNNNKVGGKKRNRWYEELWNIKYLHRFKWGHLNEKLAYERAVHNQRLRTEISQVKKESHFFVSNVEKKQRIKKYESKQKTELPVREWTFQQRDTEEEILSKKRKLEEKGHKVPGAKKSDSKSGDKKRLALDTKFLSTLFSGGVENDEDS